MTIVDGIPRTSLGHLPTPLEELYRLTASLGGPRLLIKRDDQTGLATGGNKTRALEFLVADALVRDSDSLITAGSSQSNHARQTAAAAAKCGLICHLVLQGEPPPGNCTGNLLLDDLLGARVHWAGARRLGQSMQALESELHRVGHRPYVVPYGGSNEVGILGYALGMEELHTQATSQAIRLNRVVVASASGGQQAGLVLGAKALGLEVGILGIAAEKRSAEAIPFMVKLARSGAQKLGLSLAFDESDFLFSEQYLGRGYARPGRAEWEAIRLLASTEGILVDPVYTGRALAGLIDLVRVGVLTPDESICFWHTGGTSGMFAWSDWLGSSELRS